MIELQEREELYVYCRDKLERFAASHGCRLMKSPDNPISLALTLDSLAGEAGAESSAGSVPSLSVTYLGSMLFNRCVSGTRVIGKGAKQQVAGIDFEGFGAHCDDYPHAYLTVAAALGTKRSDVDGFLVRLEKAMAGFQKQQSRHSSAQQ